MPSGESIHETTANTCRASIRQMSHRSQSAKQRNHAYDGYSQLMTAHIRSVGLQVEVCQVKWLYALKLGGPSAM